MLGSDLDLSQYASLVLDDIHKDSDVLLMSRLYSGANKHKHQKPLDKDVQWMDDYLLKQVSKAYNKQKDKEKKFDKNKKLNITIPDAIIKRTNPRSILNGGDGREEQQHFEANDDENRATKFKENIERSKRDANSATKIGFGEYEDDSSSESELEEIQI